MGRLDLNSEGLLLLTNDGELANRLTHPKKEVDKVYLVWLSRYIPGCEASIASPIEIDGRTTRPAKVETLRAEDETALLRITIHEGRNRQIRRLCERANVTVTRLRRIAEGEAWAVAQAHTGRAAEALTPGTGMAAALSSCRKKKLHLCAIILAK